MRAKIALGLIPLLLVGCATTGGGGANLDPTELEIILQGAHKAVERYVEARVDDPTPEQQLAIDMARTLVQLWIYKVESAGAIAEANKLREEADLMVEIEPLEPPAEGEVE